MRPDPRSLAEQISSEAGLPFIGTEGRDGEGRQWLELLPEGYPAGQTFTIRSQVGWRRLDVHFRAGTFAGDLLMAMGSADQTGKATFRAILELCQSEGAEIDFSVNRAKKSFEDDGIWDNPWLKMSLTVGKGMLAINDGNAAQDQKVIELWTSRVAAAILALMPLEVQEDEYSESDPEGLPEGARTRIEVNRYERDRRNRAAALAIHGFSCKACRQLLDDRYGSVAAELIEVHHITPVSQLGPGYVINPKHDLVPLCPNCHSVAHRRSPPYTVQELREMMAAVNSESL
jgi:5-methylcytosine-specific restriction protein A